MLKYKYLPIAAEHMYSDTSHKERSCKHLPGIQQTRQQAPKHTTALHKQPCWAPDTYFDSY